MKLLESGYLYILNNMVTVSIKKEEYARLKKLERSFGKLFHEVAPFYEMPGGKSPLEERLLQELRSSQRDINKGKGKILRSLKALR